MSIIGSIVKYVAKEAIAPALDEFGRKVGTAFGKRLGRRIDPAGEHEDGDDCKCDECESKKPDKKGKNA